MAFLVEKLINLIAPIWEFVVNKTCDLILRVWDLIAGNEKNYRFSYLAPPLIMVIFLGVLIFMSLML
tara:strand:- start:169 stop:369 length:201 start_codon:yes stop_codon:yes gene_type:complete